MPRKKVSSPVALIAALALVSFMLLRYGHGNVKLSSYIPRDDDNETILSNHRQSNQPSYTEISTNPEINSANQNDVSNNEELQSDNPDIESRKSSRNNYEKENVARANNKATRLSELIHSQINTQSALQSPVCHPHFQTHVSNNSWRWSNRTQFKRLYFFHARKAGGTSLADYFARVARHHGLEFAQDEFLEAEEPGTHDLPTFYVTHLREPIGRSISHFKYQGRWLCRGQLLDMRSGKFVPTEENAKKIETWNSTGGHSPLTCNEGKFKLGECAVNCYTQWFSGLSCPQYKIPPSEQYQSARALLLKYNFIVALEKLEDPAYASAVERFFGVPGVTAKRGAYCQRSSHKANLMNPLKIKKKTMNRLVRLNKLDVSLYKELTDCFDNKDGGNNTYDFPKFEPSRFDNITFKVPYDMYNEWKSEERRKMHGEKVIQTTTITIEAKEEPEEEDW